ncbi:dicarboxylate/amino acid:cation symporter [Desulforhopalus sp. IMCC35007]|uniref:dicarboxylate/amino acid:cation symporter n=1 Tax=Desulforhopalus sp. IMCC35007 TaxID=2569543 RepID=UPI00145E92C8|nr:dicarboxylate/amino acid:cation symporter [Desulforhopalus sp. IMCC35007]
MVLSKKKIGLANKIFIGMVIGLAIGFIFPEFGISLNPIGMLFMKLLKMAVVPLIFANVVYGIGQMDDARHFGKAGSKLMIYYMLSTFIAAMIGAFIGKLFKPGIGITLDTAVEDTTVKTMSGFWDTLSSFVPGNIFSAMSDGALPQVILFAIFTGIAILLIGGETKTRLTGAFKDISTLMLKVIMMVMELAPYGIAALMAWTAGKFGMDIFGPFARFFTSVYIALILQVIIVYLGVIFLFVRLNPLTFLKKVKPVWLTAFTLCSSAATIPVSLRVTEEDLGLPTSITSFSIPLGATMNMDGNAIWFGIMGVFASQIVGLDITFITILQFSLMGLILTLGSPGIPGGIFVSTTIFLASFGLPIEAGAMMIGLFRILDMGITATNMVGDIAGSTLVSKMENLFDGKTSKHWQK